MKQTLQKLTHGHVLTVNEARDVMLKITSGDFTNEEVAAFLMAINMRSWVVSEIQGFREAMLEQSLQVNFDQNTIDIVGTGGDGKNTFNISTCTAIVVAGAGYPVAKHGSYSVSSISGSANVLHELGVTFSNNQDQLRRCIEQTNFCFLHAPLFHPAMKKVIPIRRALKISTVFNILGPLINPSNTFYGLFGVNNIDLASIYSEVLQGSTITNAVVHNIDGYDEISLTDKALVIRQGSKKYIDSTNFDWERIKPESIFGGSTVKQAAKIFLSVLNDSSSVEQKQVVLANAALAIQLIEPNKSLIECKEKAEESIKSGAAERCLKKVIAITKH